MGRRGLLGGIATIKIIGAASERGYSLDQMQKLFENVTDPTRLGTIGFSVSGCSLPVGESGIKLAPGEVELGLGVHGEPGIKRSKEWAHFYFHRESIQTLLYVFEFLPVRHYHFFFDIFSK